MTRCTAKIIDALAPETAQSRMLANNMAQKEQFSAAVERFLGLLKFDPTNEQHLARAGKLVLSLGRQCHDNQDFRDSNACLSEYAKKCGGKLDLNEAEAIVAPYDRLTTGANINVTTRLKDALLPDSQFQKLANAARIGLSQWKESESNHPLEAIIQAAKRRNGNGFDSALLSVFEGALQERSKFKQEQVSSALSVINNVELYGVIDDKLLVQYLQKSGDKEIGESFTKGLWTAYNLASRSKSPTSPASPNIDMFNGLVSEFEDWAKAGISADRIGATEEVWRWRQMPGVECVRALRDDLIRFSGAVDITKSLQSLKEIGGCPLKADENGCLELKELSQLRQATLQELANLPSADQELLKAKIVKAKFPDKTRAMTAAYVLGEFEAATTTLGFKGSLSQYVHDLSFKLPEQAVA